MICPIYHLYYNPMSPPSQAKVHRALLLGVLTDARHVFTPVRNLYATFLHVSFRLLVSNQGASPREPTAHCYAAIVLNTIQTWLNGHKKIDTRPERMSR